MWLILRVKDTKDESHVDSGVENWLKVWHETGYAVKLDHTLRSRSCRRLSQSNRGGQPEDGRSNQRRDGDAQVWAK